MTVDFHVHSTASDGTFAPSALVAKAARRRFAALALTDHDNCDGVAEFLAAGTEDGIPPPHRVAGVELSIDPGAGYDRFHLLGLGIDPDHPALKAFLAKILDGRNARNGRILANFRRLGFAMDDPAAGKTVFEYAPGDILARPHFARWLIAHGEATDVPDAFARYLASDAPAATRCYEPRYRPSQEEAFAVVHAAGGLCVMAHPRYWRDAWKTQGCDYAAAKGELARLKEAGLDGLEALYQANTPAENVAWIRIASELGLVASAGSDFHGANKRNITLGMEVSDAFIAPLLERL